MHHRIITADNGLVDLFKRKKFQTILRIDKNRKWKKQVCIKYFNVKILNALIKLI